VGSVFPIVLTMAFTLTTGFTPTFEAPFVLSPLFLVELVGRADLAELRGLGGFDEAKLLGTHEAAPEGRHYKGWTWAASAAVIFGGGWAGRSSLRRSRSSINSGSGWVYRVRRSSRSSVVGMCTSII
jgi:hypothetical protein